MKTHMALRVIAAVLVAAALVWVLLSPDTPPAVTVAVAVVAIAIWAYGLTQRLRGADERASRRR